MKNWIKNVVYLTLGFVGGILACHLVLTTDNENILMPIFIVVVFTTVGFSVLANER